MKCIDEDFKDCNSVNSCSTDIEHNICNKCGKCCCRCCCRGPAGPQGPRGCPGPAGADGKSAYEIAVEEGFEGTEEEWLESLVGPQGPQGPQGPEGPEGPEGPAGADGKSAYEIAVEEGFEGTEEEWLEGLVGPQGPEGPAGADGKSAYEIAVEEGFEGTEEEWLEGLVGPQGPKGPAGATGSVGTILGSFDSLADLQNAHATGSQGDAYLVGDGDLYVWDTETETWKKVGNLRGPSGTESTIIPFSSGYSTSISSGVTGERSDVAVVGFGNVVRLTAAATDPITLPVTTSDTQANQLAFSMPADGIITAMSGFVSVASGPTLNATVTAQLYYSAAPNNSFLPVTGATIVFPEIPALADVGVVRFGTVKDLSIPVTAGTRLMMVYYHVSPILSTSPSFYLSGGLRIES